MNIKVIVPSILRKSTDGQEVVVVKAQSVRECLNNLTDRFPALKRRLYDKQGDVASYIHIFVNKKQASTGELLNDGDELLILLSVAGG